MRKSVHVIITGKVQGVSYRAWTVQTANGLGIDGWVRNRQDGTVEAVFSGEAHTVQAILEACKKGPPAARVSHIAVEDTQPPPGRGFRPLPTV